MQDLIGAPLRAACDAQLMLAGATANFIQEVGFNKDKDGNLTVRNVDFKFTKPVIGESGVVKQQDVALTVPMLSIVTIPNLAVKSVDISFDMEVKSSFEDKSSLDVGVDFEAGLKVGPFSLKVKGNVSAHKENTRKSDNSAKYHVAVQATDDGMPEGLARVLDIMQSAIAPVDKGDPKPVTA